MQRPSETFRTAFLISNDWGQCSLRARSGETRCAFLGESSVFIGDGAADCGRIAALAVFETAADTEFAMAVFAADCPKLAGIFSFAGMVMGDHAFIIVGGF